MTSGVQLDSLGIRSTTMPRVSQPDLHPGLVYSDFFSKFYSKKNKQTTVKIIDITITDCLDYNDYNELKKGVMHWDIL